MDADRLCSFYVDLWDKGDSGTTTTTVRKLLFADVGQERPILDDDDVDEPNAAEELDNEKLDADPTSDQSQQGN